MMKCYIPVYDEDGIFHDEYKYIGEFETGWDAAYYAKHALGVDLHKTSIYNEDECVYESGTGL